MNTATITTEPTGVRPRVALAALLLTTAVPALLFAPVFGLPALLPPVAVVLVLCFAVAELCWHFPVLTAPRAPLIVFAGLIGIVETELRDTTVAGLPTGATLSALVDGGTRSWLMTLQTTWPARPEPDLLLFVPLATLLVAVLGTELLRRPLLALLPSLVFLGISQAFVASTGPAALLAGLGYAAAAGILLGVTRTGGQRTRQTHSVRSVLSATALVLPTALIAVIAAVIGLAVIPVRSPAVALHDHPASPPVDQLANPLDELDGWLRQPSDPVFSYTATAPVDRWRLAVLDNFDGVSWTPDQTPYRRTGLAIAPSQGITVTTAEQSARLNLLGDAAGPWLPSQPMPASVSGVDSLIDQQSGTLIAAQPRAGSTDYALSWWEPQINADTLATSAIDPTQESGAALGAVPPGISELASTAVHGLRPSFQAALVLARYLSQHYQLATGTDPPTGAGWPQLRSFLLDTKRGTTAQFAASYVVLARLLGIPARIAVGFHASRPGNSGRVVVHDGDAFAWPEIAVSGVGWVPVDPTGVTSSAVGPGNSLTGAVDKALSQLPKQQDLRSQPLPTTNSTAAPTSEPFGTKGILVPIVIVLLILLALAILGMLALPVVRRVRYWRRRRLPGALGVVAACQETIDRLRANGVPVSNGMTVRELVATAAPHVSRPVVVALRQLADVTDLALWSGLGVVIPDQAWAAVEEVRRGLRTRPPAARLRAVFSPAGLFGSGIVIRN
ncbi:MAG TPA: transglutaminaseTgpA domain-containing protein, partial [Pseudonocardiaceae bacterium]